MDHLNGILYVDHLLEHEKLAAAGTHIAEGQPHMHDLEVELHVDHNDEDIGPLDADVEVVHSTIKFSDLYSQSSVDQMQYDLRLAGYVPDSLKSLEQGEDPT